MTVVVKKRKNILKSSNLAAAAKTNQNFSFLVAKKALTISDFCVIIIKPTSFGSTVGEVPKWLKGLPC